MAFSLTVVHELEMEAARLRNELTDMQSEAAKIRNRLAAIEQIIGPQAAEVAHAAALQHPMFTTETPLAILPFREAIRRVLRKANRAMTPAEVKREIEKHDAAPGGATPLSVRVGNELHRLKKKGQVVHDESGYRLKGD